MLLRIAFGLSLLGAAPVAFGFGPTAHQAVGAEAIEALPGGLKSFYKANRLEMGSLALEPSFPDEGSERRFPIDRVLAFPFLDLETSEKEYVAHRGASPGRLPWLIQESYGRLVEAFKARDKAKVLSESDMLLGLVTDFSNPLAVTDNADGQKTEMHGLWARFSIKLPEAMQRRLKLEAEAARFLDAPDRQLLWMLVGTYVWVDNLLYAEALAKRGQTGYGERYFEALEVRAGPILRDRLAQAATDAASYWYTAWTNAGRPDLK
ncbi:MAG TPA: hypothetical protein VFM88_09215 [Vicinamibacteria bacterium]|nr:hypothetical protein [Vicinamibacteria bacterium]